MVDENAAAQITMVIDLVKRITDQKHLEATALEAARRAGTLIRARGEFIPRRITRSVRTGQV
jgi:hypothetical protein